MQRGRTMEYSRKPASQTRNEGRKERKEGYGKPLRSCAPHQNPSFQPTKAKLSQASNRAIKGTTKPAASKQARTHATKQQSNQPSKKASKDEKTASDGSVLGWIVWKGTAPFPQPETSQSTAQATNLNPSRPAS